MDQYFSAPWGKWVRVITATVVPLLLGIPAYIAWVAGSRLQAMSFVFALPLIVVLATIPFAVTGYRLRPDELLVTRPGRTTHIPLTGLQSAEAKPGVMARSLRTWGNGGLFAFSGYFRNKALGPYQAFVTDGSRTVVLRFADRTVVVSPEPVDGFVESIRQLTGATSPTSRSKDY